MATETLTIEEQFLWHQDPLQECAGQPVIAQHSFESLATELVEYTEITYTADELVALFFEISKKYTACGANNNEKYAIIRKNPEKGWTKIVAQVQETP